MVARKWPVIYLLLMAMLAAAVCLRGRYGASESCEMDGQPLAPSLQVDLKMADGRWHRFCSIRCASRWLARQAGAAAQEAVVRDALTGEPLDSYVAIFVRSTVVTNPANGNDVHAFRFRTDATEHIRRFQGREIEDPFGVK
jgi:hypothetical protein